MRALRTLSQLLCITSLAGMLAACGSGTPARPASATPSPKTGSGWQVAQPFTTPGQYPDLVSIAVLSANNLWAVGNYAGNSGARPLIAHNDGASWNVIPSYTPDSISYLHSVAGTAANDIWAVGEDQHHGIVEHWNGSAWTLIPVTPVGDDTSERYWSVAALASNDVWITGEYYHTSGSDQGSKTLFLHYNGAAWTRVSSPSPGKDINEPVAIDALSPHDIWAVGEMGVGTNITTLALHWNGATWKMVATPSPNTNDGLDAVTAVTTNDVWAVGSTGIGDSRTTLSEHWDGSTWKIIPGPSPDKPDAGLSGIVARAPNDIWAVGATHPVKQMFALAEHWDGSAWSYVPTPVPGANGENEFENLALMPSGGIIAVGETLAPANVFIALHP